ncbi:CBS domain-containing protein [Streptomyces sp. ISL-100]|uniref:CBS domain-containing protein n=1 Tax=Streptomyces sp. ISL-100 TaxID=2819173 RepID=UPI001BE7CA8A|nr:CBS domain-containing protein [Streptomyces sp. ISL-100]MBT2396703.1 CBS domain-containing protein [Streptomyces sp. ISL-100]
MLARDLAETYPYVSVDADAVDAARLLARHKLPALLVVDADHRPYAIVPGSQLIKQLVPDYLIEEPLLAAVIDDRHLGEVAEKIAGLTVAEWLPKRTYTPPVVGPDAGLLHVAALMARTRSPLVAVIERDGDQISLLGAITAASLMTHLIGEA